MKYEHPDSGDVPIAYLIERAKAAGVFAYDIETTSLDQRNGKIKGISFYVPAHGGHSQVRAWYPFVEDTFLTNVFVCTDCRRYSFDSKEFKKARIGGALSCRECGALATPHRYSVREKLDCTETFTKLQELFLIESILAVGYGKKFDDPFIRLQSGVEPTFRFLNKSADGMLAVYMQDERYKQYGLKQTAKRFFNVELDKFSQFMAKKGHDPNQGEFVFMTDKIKRTFAEYAMDDAEYHYKCFDEAMRRMREQDPTGRLEKIFWKIEMEVQPIIEEMEQTGVRLDWKHLKKVAGVLNDAMKEVYAEISEVVKGQLGWETDYNPNSAPQTSDLLFNPPEMGGLGLPTEGLVISPKSGKYPTGEKVIKHFAPKHPVVNLLLRWRSLDTLRANFADKLYEIGKKQGRVYAKFNQTGTVIGRLSSSDPVNLMNQPRAKNLEKINGDKDTGFIRYAFCSHTPEEESDLLLFGADYGQIELRVAAHLANEPTMLAVYNNPTCDCEAYKASYEKDPEEPRCEHVDLHTRTAVAVDVPRNPLAKCLDGDTLILPSGQWPRTIASVIGGIEPGEHRPLLSKLSLRDGRGGEALANSGLKRHKRPTKIVVTKRAVVVATDDHRFQVIGDYDSLDPNTPGYVHEQGFSLVEAQNLEGGMKVPLADCAGEHSDEPEWHEQATPVEFRLNPFTKEPDPEGPASIKLDEDWAYFAGIFHGDGCASGNACAITHGNGDEYSGWRQTVKDACEAVGLPTSVSKDRRQTRLGSRVVRRYLEAMGLCKEKGKSGARHMRVPSWVMAGGPKIIWSYLAGLFDTDGTVGKKIRGTASITTKYPEFAGQIALLLRWLGMPILVSPGWNKTYHRYYYTIHVLGEGLGRFLRYCPLRFREKIERLRERCNTIKRKCAPKNDEVVLVLDGGERTVYDFQVDSDDHLYFQGGLIGHNNLNFGLLYRMGADKFCVYADLYDKHGEKRIPYARSIIRKWFAAYEGIRQFHRETEEFLKKNGWISYTMTGRRRRLDQEKEKSEYTATTQGIQFRVSGSAQDIMKLGMISIRRNRAKKIANSPPAERKQWRRLRFLIQVHDEILMQGPQCLKHEIKELIETSMSGAASLKVPLTVNCKYGRTWNHVH